MADLVVTIGPAGSGKSSWLDQRFPETQIVSLDKIRGWLTDSQSCMDVNREAVDLRTAILRVRGARGLTTAVDATNLQPRHRAALLDIAREFWLVPIAVVFDTHLTDCLIRNTGRTRQVPEPVIRDMYEQFLKHTPPDGPVPGFAITHRVGPGGAATWTQPWRFDYTRPSWLS